MKDYQMGFRHLISKNTNNIRESNLSYHEVLFRTLKLIRNADAELYGRISFNVNMVYVYQILYLYLIWNQLFALVANFNSSNLTSILPKQRWMLYLFYIDII